MRYWVLTGVVVVAFLLQSVVSTYLAIRGITPDILLVVVVSYGLLFGWQVGLGAGVLAGLLVDLTAGRFIGIHVLSLGLVGVLAGVVEEKVFKDNILLAPSGGLVGSVLNQSVLLLCLWLFGWQISFGSTLRATVLPAALYDMALSILVYHWIYKYYRYLRPDPRGTISIRRY